MEGGGQSPTPLTAALGTRPGSDPVAETGIPRGTLRDAFQTLPSVMPQRRLGGRGSGYC